MDPITITAATALVTAMTTDTWQQTRTAVVSWWRRSRPEQADAVDAALVASRQQVLQARQRHDTAIEAQVLADWQARLTPLFRDARAADYLSRLLTTENAGRERAEDIRTGNHRFDATASGHGRVYQAGRDQKIVES